MCAITMQPERRDAAPELAMGNLSGLRCTCGEPVQAESMAHGGRVQEGEKTGINSCAEERFARRVQLQGRGRLVRILPHIGSNLLLSISGIGGGNQQDHLIPVRMNTAAYTHGRQHQRIAFGLAAKAASPDDHPCIFRKLDHLCSSGFASAASNNYLPWEGPSGPASLINRSRHAGT